MVSSIVIDATSAVASGTVIDATSAEISTTLVEKNLREGLTRAGFIEYQTTCMAMLLVVVSTGATDPTRESGPFQRPPTSRNPYR